MHNITASLNNCITKNTREEGNQLRSVCFDASAPK